VSNRISGDKSDGTTWLTGARWWVLLGAVLVAVGAVYGRVIGFEAIPAWDDALFVLDRETITDWWGVGWYERLATPEIGYPMPVPTFIYAHLRWLGGEAAYPHVLHVLNLGIHLCNIVLVACLAARWSRASLGIAVAALWGLHPICVESVAWLTNLKTVMAVFLVLAALLSWECSYESEERGASTWRLLAVGLFVLALGCRPDVVVLVPLIVARSLWRLGWSEALRRDGAWMVGLTVLGGAWVLWAKIGHDAVVDKSAVMPGTQSLPIRMARALELTARHLFIPVDLDPGYFRNPSAGAIRALPGLVVAVGLSVLFVGSLAARWYQIAFGLAVFGVWYAPYSGIVFLPRFTADTYLYGPSIGMMFATVAGVDRWWSRRSRSSSRWRVGVVVAVCAGLAALTALQVGRWENGETLWKPVLAEHPRVVRPYEQLIWHYAKRQQWDRAVEVADRGLPVFRESKTYPYFLGAVYDDGGYPERAANLAMEAVLHDADPVDLHYKTLLDVWAQREIPSPNSERALKALHRAVAVYQRHDEWMARRSDRLHIADYLTKKLDPKLAMPFVEWELATARPDCFAWIAGRRIRQSGGETFELPPLPERCGRGDAGGDEHDSGGR